MTFKDNLDKLLTNAKIDVHNPQHIEFPYKNSKKLSLIPIFNIPELIRLAKEAKAAKEVQEVSPLPISITTKFIRLAKK